MDSNSEFARDFFVTGLRNQHAVENQAIELLGRQIDRLENYPEMSAMLRRHQEESRQQAQRIEELLAGFDTSHSAVKDTMMSIVGNMAALAHTPAPDEVVKNTFANFAFEHFEIAAYTSLITVAESIGQSNALTALKQSLSEEQAMAVWISQQIAPTTLRYINLSQAGQTAGR